MPSYNSLQYKITANLLLAQELTLATLQYFWEKFMHNNDDIRVEMAVKVLRYLKSAEQIPLIFYMTPGPTKNKSIVLQRCIIGG
jgi:hypothetical protein